MNELENKLIDLLGKSEYLIITFNPHAGIRETAKDYLNPHSFHSTPKVISIEDKNVIITHNRFFELVIEGKEDSLVASNLTLLFDNLNLSTTTKNQITDFEKEMDQFFDQNRGSYSIECKNEESDDDSLIDKIKKNRTPSLNIKWEFLSSEKNSLHIDANANSLSELLKEVAPNWAIQMEKQYLDASILDTSKNNSKTKI